MDEARRSGPPRSNRGNRGRLHTLCSLHSKRVGGTYAKCCLKTQSDSHDRYILSTHLGPQLIDTNKATLDLAIRCIDYVCQRHHDVDLSPEDVSNNVLTGQYSFHAFSIKMWFELSCQLLRSTSGPDAPAEFVDSLQRLWDTRRARSSQTAEVDTAANSDEDVGSHEAGKDQIIFDQLKGEPVLHQLLCDVLRFRNSSAQSTGTTDQGAFPISCYDLATP